MDLDATLPVIIVSKEHHLLPLAHRLRNIEGVPTTTIVWKKSYERAWDGMVEKDLLASEGEIRRESIEVLEDAARAGSPVVHDVPTLLSAFEGAPLVYPATSLASDPVRNLNPVRFGGWFDGNGVFAPHVLVYDMGAWPGGMGRQVPGGLTLIAVGEQWSDVLPPPQFPDGFRGLFNVEIIQSEEGFSVGEYEYGWPHLHTQAFMGGAHATWSRVLTGDEVPELHQHYTVALPVTIPPWPSSNHKAVGRAMSDLLIELDPAAHSNVYWHDVRVDTEEKALFTAGLDGLVGVVHASYNTFEAARLKVLQVAQMLQVPERQLRVDVGAQVPGFLAGLEEAYGMTL